MSSCQHCYSFTRPLTNQYLQTLSFSTFGKCRYGNKCFSNFCEFSHPCWKQCKFDKDCKNDSCKFQHSVQYCGVLTEEVISSVHKSPIECVYTGKEYYCLVQKVTKHDGKIAYIAFASN